ncbi:MAG: anti-phage ZorAB system protein ZorA [Methylococcaceae bacterium]
MTLITNIPHTYYFFALLVFFGICFFIFFCIPWLKVSSKLSTVNKKLTQLNGKDDGSLDQIFKDTGLLENIWAEYKDTLHKQTEIDPSTGLQRIVRTRLTVPAEVYFRADIIVDTPLKADFFKHLPGILTGIGIIGTFWGLLDGLTGFEISDNTARVQASLTGLLQGVSHSFEVSAAAIALAMFITFFEKIAITSLNAQVEKLTQLLDGLFEAGAGEEYLSRLVKTSEATTSQIALVKDAIVVDLRQILIELTQQQIAATNATQQQQIIAQREFTEQQIAATNKLLGPLEKIGEEIGGERTDNGAAVQKMLVDVMAAFTDQIKDLFGNQLQDINSLQGQTISALQTAVTSMETMVTKFGNAGTDGANDMAKILTEAMKAAELRQQNMNDKIAGLLEQINLTNIAGRDSGSESVTGMAKILADAIEAADIRQQSMNEQMTVLLEQIKLANIDAKNTGAEGATDMAKILADAIEAADIRQQSMNEQMTVLLEQIKLANIDAKNTGAEGATDMAKILADAIEAADIRQQSMNEQMTVLLEQIKLANIDAKNTGSEGVTDMAKILTEAMEAAERRQQSMNEQMTALLKQIKLSLKTSQGETQNKFNESLDGISTTMSTLLDALGKQSGKITTEGEKVVGDFGSQVKTIANGVNEAVAEMKKAVESMRKSTNEALSKMNSGANTLAGAATDFAKAGEGVVGTLDKSKLVADQLSQASGSIASVSSGLTSILADYKSARDSMADLVGSMKGIVEQARKDASMSDDVLKRIESATSKLIAAQHEADSYLAKVKEVIKTSHDEFTSGMNKSLGDLTAGITRVVGDANSNFHQDLTTAVGLLRGGVGEISEVFEEAAEKVTQAANRVNRH